MGGTEVCLFWKKKTVNVRWRGKMGRALERVSTFLGRAESNFGEYLGEMTC